MRSPKALWIAGLLVLVGISVWKALNVYTEWLWISQVGYASVFVTIYKARLVLLLVVGLVLFLWLWSNCRIARRSRSEDITFIGKRLLPPAERAAIEQHIDKAIIIVTLLVAVVGAILASHRALPLLQFMNATSFTADDGATVLRDPIFGREIAFYVFRLPFIEYIYGVIFNGVLVALVLAALVYLYEEGLRVVPGTVHLAPHVRRHLFSLLAAAFVIRGIGFWLDRFKLLTSQGSGESVYGIGYTDLYARIPVYWFLAVVALVCAVVAIVAIRRLSVRAVGLALGGLIVFALLGRWAAPAVVQAIVVKPSELGRERGFLAYNIAHTRDAYGLSRVTEAHHASAPLTAKEVAANPATINNLRLWDDRPLETAANRMASLRTYYEFADVDIDRYIIDGELRQVMLSGRQLNVQNLKPERQTWVNTHMQYTHGYGLALAPVNEIGEGGRPNFFIKDIPPRYPPPAGLEKLGVPPERAGLYYQVAVEREPTAAPPAAAPGESAGEEPPPPAPGTQAQGPGATRRGPHLVQRVKTTTDFCIVGAAGDEFDYPAIATEAPSLDPGESDPEASENVMTRYLDKGGKGGVPISGFFRRFAFFARFRSWPLLFSSDVWPESRILMHRTVYERISAIAPFLALDWDPYLVIADEKLHWITDAYTVTDRYPYSEQAMIGSQKLNLNYMRNAVKVCVDAYDGTVDFYVFDDQDAILQTFRKIFPDVFKDRTEMPTSLGEHIRYPEVQFIIQSQMYQLYHMQNVTDFYQQEDRWDFPDEEFAGTRRTMEAYYVVMTLPEGDGGRDAEFLLMTPFTPFGKSDLNMLAWMCARCDPEHYGELMVYKFPKDRMIQGPMMVEVAIGADGEISEMETLWGGTGSSVIRGNLLVIPIADSVLYLEPLYVQAVRSGIPELRIVVIGANDRIAWGATLDEALNKMFGPGAARSAVTPRPDVGAVTPRPGVAPALTPEATALVRQIRDQYYRAQEALRTEGFAAYEREQKELGQLIDRLWEQTRSEPTPAAAEEPPAAGD